MKTVRFSLMYLLAVLVIALAVSVVADTPPPLTGFQQFYGEVKELPTLPAGSVYTIKLVIGSTTVPATLAADGKYGYNPNLLKVTGINGATITFLVYNGTADKLLGTTTYQGGEVTKKDWSYVSGAIGGESPPAASSSSSSSSSGGGSPGSGRTTTRTGTEGLPAGQCKQNWECSLWSACLSARETRACYRVDICDTLKSSGKVTTILTSPKPEEARSCQAAATTTVCLAQTKRCLGSELQQCAADGSRWNTLQFCPARCNPTALTCIEEAALPPTEQKPFSSWITYAAGGIIALVVIIIVIAMLFISRKKYGPLKEYISESRDSGLSDAQIKSKLDAEGWDESKVEKFLK